MKKLILAIVLFLPIRSFAATEPDWDAVIPALFPGAQSGVDYIILHQPYTNAPIMGKWTLTASTPTFSDLVIAYNKSMAKATLDAQAQALQLKLGLSATEFQQLKTAVKQ